QCSSGYTYRFFVSVLAAITLLVSGTAVADRDPAMERLQALGTALRTRSTWTASYAQEYVPPGMSLGEQVSGQVWVAWPDRALFSTGSPVVRWMGLKGRLVRLLDFENLSCDEHLLTAEEWERIPLIAVLDPRAALAQFSIVADGERSLILIPREAGGVARVEIVTGKNGLPARVVVSDPQGAVSTFVFTDWEAAQGPPEGAWLPAPPDDISCIADPE
ncbi:MAG: outer-membrane lipoprotein carrier protein LolA, partial [Acidobacteria bacterium]|nr:outer-membrane lipoprotein carrier protein LolA [Acidobacteriota bacterium]